MWSKEKRWRWCRSAQLFQIVTQRANPCGESPTPAAPSPERRAEQTIHEQEWADLQNLDAKACRPVTSDGAMTQWKEGGGHVEVEGGWRNGWVGRGWAGVERRRGGGVRDPSSDITLALINWGNGAHTTSASSRKLQGREKEPGAGRRQEEEEEEEAASAPTLSPASPAAPAAPASVCVWPFTLWTRLPLRCILHCGILFSFFHPSFSDQDAGAGGVCSPPLFRVWWTLHR